MPDGCVGCFADRGQNQEQCSALNQRITDRPCPFKKPERDVSVLRGKKYRFLTGNRREEVKE